MKLISFGHRCSSASFIKLLNLKTESYPFDWMITKLDTIKNCIETNFIDFYNRENYKYINTETYNLIDGRKKHRCYENVLVNILYETNMDNNNTYNYQLAFNHKNIIDNFNYYDRSIKRLKKLLLSEESKMGIYFHPISGICDFNKNRIAILKEFDTFDEFIKTKTTNIFGLYFILVLCDNENKSEMIKSDDKYTVFIIYCNKNFFDGGDPFSGDFLSEKDEIIRIIKYAIRRFQV